MDLTFKVITPDVFDIPNCDPHLVEFSPDNKRVTIRGDVVIGREGHLRIKPKYDYVSRQHCMLKVKSEGWFGLKKRWTIVALSDRVTAVWAGGVILRLSRDGFKGDIRTADAERKRRGIPLEDARFERIELAKGMGVMITTDMHANLIME